MSLFDINGLHETELSSGEEADLHKHLLNCQKNPGHNQFLPIENLTIENLSENFRDFDLLKLIKATADLTVRVDVKITSEHRLEFWPNTSVPYPFYNIRNTANMRTGSGQMLVMKFVDGLRCKDQGMKMDECIEKDKRKPERCKCKKCMESDQRSNVWWEILVLTATHVVFDNVEAEHTSCRMFYDKPDSPVVILNNLTLRKAHVEKDACILSHVTCDPMLGEQLYAMSEHYFDLLEKVKDKFLHKFDEKLSFIVSHPHGCPKQLSLGVWKECVSVGVCSLNNDLQLTRLTYTTCTCPGSSGARVYSIGFNKHLHSGTMSNGLNYSSAGICHTRHSSDLCTIF